MQYKDLYVDPAVIITILIVLTVTFAVFFLRWFSKWIEDEISADTKSVGDKKINSNETKYVIGEFRITEYRKEEAKEKKSFGCVFLEIYEITVRGLIINKFVREFDIKKEDHQQKIHTDTASIFSFKKSQNIPVERIEEFEKLTKDCLGTIDNIMLGFFPLDPGLNEQECMRFVYIGHFQYKSSYLTKNVYLIYDQNEKRTFTINSNQKHFATGVMLDFGPLYDRVQQLNYICEKI